MVMKKSGTIMIIMMISIFFISMLGLSGTIQMAFAQPNPCREGQFPKTDSNGEIIKDSNGNPICVAGP